MKFEQTRIDLAPRSAANCLDLALLLCGRQLGTLFGLWALFAVPLGTITYFVARWTDWGFLAALACGWFGTAPFGVMLIGGIARMTFGEEFTLHKVLADLPIDGPLIAQVLVRRIPLALASCLCLFPGALLALRWGFLVESRVLTRLHEQRHDHRTSELVKKEFSDLGQRGGALFFAGAIGWVILEMTVDLAWTILFSRPLFLGRLSEMGSMISHELYDDVILPEYFENVWKLAFADPAVLTLHLTTGLVVYVVCRIAWFLCYIDLRVRCDCWDLELELLDEARRLRMTP